VPVLNDNGDWIVSRNGLSMRMPKGGYFFDGDWLSANEYAGEDDIKVFLHACGSIEPLIPYIIEAGVDILNPVQISAANMDPAVLKERYGDKICFWGGGCDTQSILPNPSPDEIRGHVLTKTLPPCWIRLMRGVFINHPVNGNKY